MKSRGPIGAIVIAVTLAGTPGSAQEIPTQVLNPSVTVVKVVNMIPERLSGELHQDSETNLAVNPANPHEMAASAFIPGQTFCAPDIAPVRRNASVPYDSPQCASNNKSVLGRADDTARRARAELALYRRPTLC